MANVTVSKEFVGRVYIGDEYQLDAWLVGGNSASGDPENILSWLADALDDQMPDTYAKYSEKRYCLKVTVEIEEVD